MSRIKLLLLVGIATLTLGLSWNYIVDQNLERLQDANIKKAEAFKREFDGRYQAGAPVGHVEAYLESTGKRWVPGFATHGHVSEIRVTVATGETPVWYCGEESVGMVAHFKDDVLVDTAVATWNLNCL